MQRILNLECSGEIHLGLKTWCLWSRKLLVDFHVPTPYIILITRITHLRIELARHALATAQNLLITTLDFRNKLECSVLVFLITAFVANFFPFYSQNAPSSCRDDKVLEQQTQIQRTSAAEMVLPGEPCAETLHNN